MRFVAIAALCIVTVGCGWIDGALGGSEPEAERSLIERILTEPLPADPGPDVGGPALEVEVFADGVVTFDEYERAVYAAIECMRAEGFVIEGPHRYPDALFVTVGPGWDPSLLFTFAARDVDDDDRWTEVSDRCQAQWSYRIEQVWLEQNAPSEAEVQAWLDRAWTCLRERGAQLSDPPTPEEALQVTAYGCRPWEADD